MIGIKLRNATKKTNTNDILEEITKPKWKQAGHVAHMKDNRIIDGLSDAQSGKLETEKDRGEDQIEDGGTIFSNGWELHGQEKQRTDRSGEIWRMATSSSGGTQPRYKVQQILRIQ